MAMVRQSSRKLSSARRLARHRTVKFKVALLQITPHGNDQGRNLAKGLDYCRRAKGLGADLVLFPELWSVGSARSLIAGPTRQRLWDESAIDQDSTFLRCFADQARDLGVNIAITYLESWHPKPRNSVSIIDTKGEVVLNYSKVYICDFPQDGNNSSGCDVNCCPGNSYAVCRLIGSEGEVGVGAMICADREFPEPATQLMLNGAELIVVPNDCEWDEVRNAGLLTRACENLIGVATANYPRPLNNGNSIAYSCVTWKDGKPQSSLVAAAGEQEELLLAEFDLDEIREFRRSESWRLAHRHCGAVPRSHL
jgi:predicted amidohydrolase